MAYKVGVCTGHYELFEIIRRFAKGHGTTGTGTAGGGNTGNGTIGSIDLSPAGTNETWTVACIDDTTAGEELWSVTGSVTGSLDQYTTGNVYDQTDIGFVITAGGTDFVVGDEFTLTGATFTGTGNGTIDSIDPTPSAVAETWTVACTDASTPGSEVWSVTGSVSGAQASATTGVAYTNTYVEFSITAGGTNFAVSDQFVFDTDQGTLSAAGQAWVEERYDDATLDGEGLQDLELILRGPGLSGTEQIWASFTTNQSVTSDYYNMILHTHIGYVSSNALVDQPGYIGDRVIPMWNATIRYWLCVNGQRIAIACKVETHYMSGYVGKFNPYATPNQYPYAITVGAMTTTTTLRYSSSSSFPYDDGMAVRKVDGTWGTFKGWPYNQQTTITFYYQGLFGQLFTTYPAKDTGGDYPLLPLVLYNPTTLESYGELDGIFYAPGFNSAVENTVVAESKTHVKIANNQGTGFNSYYGLRLD